jgi:hypothetical protein
MYVDMVYNSLISALLNSTYVWVHGDFNGLNIVKVKVMVKLIRNVSASSGRDIFNTYIWVHGHFNGLIIFKAK